MQGVLPCFSVDMHGPVSWVKTNFWHIYACWNEGILTTQSISIPVKTVNLETVTGVICHRITSDCKKTHSGYPFWDCAQGRLPANNSDFVGGPRSHETRLDQTFQQRILKMISYCRVPRAKRFWEATINKKTPDHLVVSIRCESLCQYDTNDTC
jgi:hypothetical protein